ncbi:hypothetical protein SCP_0700180 [Sparassis crispa]|uniref:Uncharacterized protein n=1 Tax=Sparassis crispa TaxID=139825 RepID=A0A401GRI1_9APHY|nr:hypothetical protein SCP_0700180 [Sparassis crispa]GBE84838.1 hypothetical protein SCP_0700180 [Sparassis crispa]
MRVLHSQPVPIGRLVPGPPSPLPGPITARPDRRCHTTLFFFIPFSASGNSSPTNSMTPAALQSNATPSPGSSAPSAVCTGPPNFHSPPCHFHLINFQSPIVLRAWSSAPTGLPPSRFPAGSYRIIHLFSPGFSPPPPAKQALRALGSFHGRVPIDNLRNLWPDWISICFPARHGPARLPAPD